MFVFIQRKHETPICVVNVGLPGAGKSTGTARLMATPSRIKEAATISSDNILEAIARYKGKTYSEVWKDHIGYADEKCREYFNTSVMCGEDIIVDCMNVTKKSRAKWLGELPEHYTKIAIYYHIEDPFKVVRLGKRIPVGTLARKKRELEIPSADEGFDLILRTDDMGESFTVLHIKDGLKPLAEELGIVEETNEGMKA